MSGRVCLPIRPVNILWKQSFYQGPLPFCCFANTESEMRVVRKVMQMEVSIYKPGNVTSEASLKCHRLFCWPR